jgi:hypothetical protein
MTIIEASALLYDFFNKNDYICDLDIASLRQEALLESDKAAIFCALDSFRESHIVKLTSIKSRNYWILERPFKSMSQSIDVSAPVANLLGGMANNILSAAGMPKDVNPTKLTERDLMILVEFITNLLDSRKEEEKPQEPTNQ